MIQFFFQWRHGLVILLFFPKISTYKENKYQKQMSMEFKDVMLSIYGSLSAGATVEQSLERALADARRSLGLKSRMVTELDMVCRKMARNVPVNQCLEEMASRCHDKDIENFTQILILGKRQGETWQPLSETVWKKFRDVLK